MAVFKVVKADWPENDKEVTKGSKTNWRVAETTIPLPELERMIVNKAIDFVNSQHTEGRIKDVFARIAKPRRTLARRLKDTPEKKRDKEQELADAAAVRAAFDIPDPASSQQ